MSYMDPTAIEIDFDPTVQRMSGIAREGNVPFDVPYISHIHENLYTGGVANDLILPAHIEHVVSLAPWWRYKNMEDVRKSYLEVKMYDSKDGILPEKQIGQIVSWAMKCVEEGPTLIHCQAGLNRSSFIAALTLIGVYGFSGREAVDLLREKRSPAVLCNKAFENYVLSVDDA